MQDDQKDSPPERPTYVRLPPASVALIKRRLDAYVEALDITMKALGLEGLWNFNPDSGMLVRQDVPQPEPAEPESAPTGATEAESPRAARPRV
jgi:hypothetical protein